MFLFAQCTISLYFVRLLGWFSVQAIALSSFRSVSLSPFVFVRCCCPFHFRSGQLLFLFGFPLCLIGGPGGGLGHVCAREDRCSPPRCRRSSSLCHPSSPRHLPSSSWPTPSPRRRWPWGRHSSPVIAVGYLLRTSKMAARLSRSLGRQGILLVYSRQRFERVCTGREG